MTKILYVSNRTSFSGGEVVLLRLLANNSSITPIVITPPGELASRLKDLHIKTYILNEIRQLDRARNKFWPAIALKNLILGQLKVISILIKERPDLVHANALGAALYSAFPAALCAVRFIWTSHNIYHLPSSNTLLARFLSHFSQKIIAVSQAVANNLISSGVSPTKIAVIYNGLGSSMFETLPKSNLLHQKFHLGTSAHLIALVAPLSPWKGADLLIDAAAQLKKENLNFAVLLIGNEEDSRYAKKLHARVAELKLTNHVIFTGFLKNIADLYQEIDILVNASIEPEPLGTTIYEAQARGCLVVCANIGGTSEIVTDGQTGFLFSPGSSKELSDKLSFVLKNLSKLDHIRQKARHQARQKFSLEFMVRSYNDVYRSVLSKS